MTIIYPKGEGFWSSQGCRSLVWRYSFHSEDFFFSKDPKVWSLTLTKYLQKVLLTSLVPVPQRTTLAASDDTSWTTDWHRPAKGVRRNAMKAIEIHTRIGEESLIFYNFFRRAVVFSNPQFECARLSSALRLVKAVAQSRFVAPSIISKTR